MNKLVINTLAALVALSFAGASSIAATVSRHDQTASGIQGWVLTDGAIEVQLNPLLRDQVRAFYLARGFTDDVTAEIAHSCVFQTVITNVSEPSAVETVEVNLSQWQLVTESGLHTLTDKQVWLQRWDDRGASDTAMVAFRWATFPWQQQYMQSGDYGWGMILLGDDLPETFGLMVRWDRAGVPQSQLIDGLSCPQ